MRRLALALALAGCSAPTTIALVDQRGLEYSNEPILLEDLPDTVLESCDLLGLECVANTEHDYGTIVLELRAKADARHGVTGMSLINRPCTKTAWAIDEVGSIAHELGHLFGLDHAPDGNVMAHLQGRRGDYLTEKQQDRVHRRATAFAACLP